MRPMRYTSSETLPPKIARDRDHNIYLDLYALERIRAALQRELRLRPGQRSLARQIGISRGSLRKFLEDQSVPTLEVQHQLQEWTKDRPDVWTPPGAVALALLVFDLPHQSRGAARLRLARLLADVHAEEGRPVPAWLALELET
ncbi:MAG: helix-turn-helix transcriptional regulator [Gemmatimonadota bacterium]